MEKLPNSDYYYGNQNIWSMTDTLAQLNEWKFQESPVAEVKGQLIELQKQTKKIYRSTSKVDDVRRLQDPVQYGSVGTRGSGRRSVRRVRTVCVCTRTKGMYSYRVFYTNRHTS